MTFHMHPRSQASYREKTHSQHTMATADFNRFMCQCCNQSKPVKGRKQIGNKAGYRCAECAGK